MSRPWRRWSAQDLSLPTGPKKRASPNGNTVPGAAVSSRTRLVGPPCTGAARGTGLPCVRTNATSATTTTAVAAVPPAGSRRFRGRECSPICPSVRGQAPRFAHGHLLRRDREPGATAHVRRRELAYENEARLGPHASPHAPPCSTCAAPCANAVGSPRSGLGLAWEHGDRRNCRGVTTAASSGTRRSLRGTVRALHAGAS